MAELLGGDGEGPEYPAWLDDQLVLGNETNGLLGTVRPLLDSVVGIPEHNDELLGLAGAGPLVFELARRRHRQRGSVLHVRDRSPGGV